MPISANTQNTPCTQKKPLSQKGQLLSEVHFSLLYLGSPMFSNIGTLRRLCVATADKLNLMQSKPPIMNFFTFQFAEYWKCGTLTLRNVSTTDMLLLIHFQRTSSKLLADETGREKKFTTEYICSNLYTARKIVSHLVLPCGSNCL
jgi:hypothetical protein